MRLILLASINIVEGYSRITIEKANAILKSSLTTQTAANSDRMCACAKYKCIHSAARKSNQQSILIQNVTRLHPAQPERSQKKIKRSLTPYQQSVCAARMSSIKQMVIIISRYKSSFYCSEQPSSPPPLTHISIHHSLFLGEWWT